MKVKFEEKELKRLLYWIVCKFKEDEFHHQAASTKSDLIGGFFDRWFNRAPEFLIFDELLKDKKYDVIIDNFLYGQDTKKNAPDIIGLQKNNKVLVKFAVYRDGEWVKIKSMPLIEVKTNRKKQSLISVGDTQMDSNHYYVFVESNVREDYLLPIFEKSVFDKEIFNSFKDYKEFIDSDKEQKIIPLPKLKIDKELGYFKLIGIFKGDAVKECSILVGMNSSNNPEKPRYFASIEKIDKINPSMNEQLREGLYREGREIVPFYIKFLKNNSGAVIIKKLISYFVINVKGKVDINGNKLEEGYYKINFKRFDRSSKKKEYIGDKKVFENYAKNSQTDLIKIFDKLAKI